MTSASATAIDTPSLWAQLAAPVPLDAIEWRQDGKPIERDGKFKARFVPYIEAGTVRERLDTVCAGLWDLHIELLPPPVSNATGEVKEVCSFKARLTVYGVAREDVGSGDDYKAAATDAFKRAAVRFGIGHELYSMKGQWVELDGGGKYAKPTENPSLTYMRRVGARSNGNGSTPAPKPAATTAAPAAVPKPGPLAKPGATVDHNAPDVPACPKCAGKMWDNRLTKKNPQAPDFKCRSAQKTGCQGAVWADKLQPAAGADDTPYDDYLSADELPF